MQAQSRPIAAALWMVGALTGFSSMAVAGRAVKGHLDTFEVMLYRSVIGLAIILVVVLATGQRQQISARRLDLHLIRNLSHFAGQNLWFWALTAIPLAQLFALEFSYPIMVALLAPLFLSERLTQRRMWAALIGFIGILIVARPTLGAENAGIIAAFLAAVGFSGSAIATKILTRYTGIISIMFWLCLIQLALSILCAGFDGAVALPDVTTIWPVIVIGIAGLGAHFCMTKALSLAPASVVLPIDFLRLPIIGIVGMVLYNEPLNGLIFFWRCHNLCRKLD